MRIKSAEISPFSARDVRVVQKLRWQQLVGYAGYMNSARTKFGGIPDCSENDPTGRVPRVEPFAWSPEGHENPVPPIKVLEVSH
jgi:hypothetical protein